MSSRTSLSSHHPAQDPSEAASPRWTPILSGDDRERANRLLLGIGDAIADLYDKGLGERVTALDAAHHGLLFAELGTTFPDSRYRELCDRCVDLAREKLKHEDPGISLFMGIAGIAWAFDRVQDLTAAQDDHFDTNEDIDAALLSLLERPQWHRHFDLVSGLVGLGTYFCSRLERPKGRRCLHYVLQHLVRLSDSSEEGRCWYTPRSLLDESELASSPDGYYNLGIAHGTPGVAALLGRLVRLDFNAELSQDVLRETMDWLRVRSEEFQEKEGRYFGAWWPLEDSSVERLSWCYGDLGVGMAILSAGLDARNQAWSDWGLEILEACARRSQEPVAADGILCHGSAGNGHCLNRVFQATGKKIFEDAAVAWYRDLFAKHKEGAGIGGYQKWVPLDRTWHDDFGLLEGSAGIALSLLAAITDREPRWDGFLLCDLRSDLALEADPG